MHFLEIATTQPCLQSSVYAFRSVSLFNKKFVNGNEKRVRFSWKPSHNIPGQAKNCNFRRVEAWRCGLSIAAVATTLERARVTESNEAQGDHQRLRMDIDLSSSTSSAAEQPFLSGNSAELGEREKLRRLRISKANKGNTPWNKGRKHSPETLQRIRERTRLAMQDPKVKMKLVNMGHAQSEETRVKIGVGVRIGWEKRREKLMLQETCYCQWQNLIAEASRKGLLGEEELQWDSYKILDERLEEEWLQSVEQRKKMPRPKGSKRAPKSPEQRKKISEAIAAKWADPEYRSRVYSGLAKYHGIQPGVERKPRRKPSGDGETRKRSPPKKKVDNLDESVKLKSQIKRIKLKRSKVPKFKDPLASSKLEMLKSIRAQRAAAENSKSEAVARAKALIAEAMKAAKVLEAAAEKSPLAQASLIETRKLIAEATQSIEFIESAQLDSHGNGSSSDLVPPSDEAKAETEGVNEPKHIKVNGTPIVRASTSNIDDLGFNKSALHDSLNGSGHREGLLGLSSMNYDLLNGEDDLSPGSACHGSSAEVLNDMVKHSDFSMQRNDPEPNGSEQVGDSQLPSGTEAQTDGEEPPKSTNVTKKWVRGRLAEVVEDLSN